MAVDFSPLTASASNAQSASTLAMNYDAIQRKEVNYQKEVAIQQSQQNLSDVVSIINSGVSIAQQAYQIKTNADQVKANNYLSQASAAQSQMIQQSVTAGNTRFSDTLGEDGNPTLVIGDDLQKFRQNQLDYISQQNWTPAAKYQAQKTLQGIYNDSANSIYTQIAAKENKEASQVASDELLKIANQEGKKTFATKDYSSYDSAVRMYFGNIDGVSKADIQHQMDVGHKYIDNQRIINGAKSYGEQGDLKSFNSLLKDAETAGALRGEGQSDDGRISSADIRRIYDESHQMAINQAQEEGKSFWESNFESGEDGNKPSMVTLQLKADQTASKYGDSEQKEAFLKGFQGKRYTAIQSMLRARCQSPKCQAYSAAEWASFEKELKGGKLDYLTYGMSESEINNLVSMVGSCSKNQKTYEENIVNAVNAVISEETTNREVSETLSDIELYAPSYYSEGWADLDENGELVLKNGGLQIGEAFEAQRKAIRNDPQYANDPVAMQKALEKINDKESEAKKAIKKAVYKSKFDTETKDKSGDGASGVSNKGKSIADIIKDNYLNVWKAEVPSLNAGEMSPATAYENILLATYMPFSVAQEDGTTKRYALRRGDAEGNKDLYMFGQVAENAAKKYARYDEEGNLVEDPYFGGDWSDVTFIGTETSGVALTLDVMKALGQKLSGENIVYGNAGDKLTDFDLGGGVAKNEKGELYATAPKYLNDKQKLQRASLLDEWTKLCVDAGGRKWGSLFNLDENGETVDDLKVIELFSQGVGMIDNLFYHGGKDGGALTDEEVESFRDSLREAGKTDLFKWTIKDFVNGVDNRNLYKKSSIKEYSDSVPWFNENLNTVNTFVSFGGSGRVYYTGGNDSTLSHSLGNCFSDMATYLEELTGIDFVHDEDIVEGNSGLWTPASFFRANDGNNYPVFLSKGDDKIKTKSEFWMYDTSSNQLIKMNDSLTGIALGKDYQVINLQNKEPKKEFPQRRELFKKTSPNYAAENVGSFAIGIRKKVAEGFALLAGPSEITDQVTGETFESKPIWEIDGNYWEDQRRKYVGRNAEAVEYLDDADAYLEGKGAGIYKPKPETNLTIEDIMNTHPEITDRYKNFYLFRSGE